MLLFGWVAGILVVLLLWLAVYFRWLWRDYYNKGSRLPGPKPLPIVGNLWHIIKDGNVLQTLMRTVSEHNGFAAIWQGNNLIVLVSKPQYMQTFYSSNITHKADQYDTIADILGVKGIFASSGETWKRARKQFMMTFTTMPTERLIENFCWVNGFLRRELSKKADGQVFKGFLTMRLAMTHAILLNSLGETQPDDYLESLIEECLEFLQTTSFMRQFHAMERYDCTFYLTPKAYRYRRGILRMHKWMTDSIEKKKAEYQRLKANKEDIPNIWIYNMLSKFPERSMEELRDDMLNIFFTGFDTTSGALGYSLVMLGLHPEMQEKMYQEDQEVQSHVRGRELTFDDLQMYEFTDRFLRESLRLFPIGELAGRKLVEDTYFGEHLVPKNANVLAMSMVTFRDPEFFEDPMRFDPDRFLPENVEKIQNFGYNPFGAGPRICPGNRYAMIALKSYLPAIVRHFEIRTDYKSVQEVLDHACADATLNDLRGFPLILKHRTKN